MQQIHSENVTEAKQLEKKAYAAPKLTRHGKVEELTQGFLSNDCSGPIEYKLPN